MSTFGLNPLGRMSTRQQFKLPKIAIVPYEIGIGTARPMALVVPALRKGNSSLPVVPFVVRVQLNLY